MISTARVRDAFEVATKDFAASPVFKELIAGQASPEALKEFIRNVFRTHFLSSHIVALCFASLPSRSASLLKENLLEEMGRSEEDKPHSALLLELAGGAGFSEREIDSLISDAQRQIGVFCATSVPFATVRELCLSVLLETMGFEFMLSRCSGQIAESLRRHYLLCTEALKWFELHSEVDIRHAEEGLTVIQDYLSFHQISDGLFERILRLTLQGNVFVRRYFPPASDRTRQRSPAAQPNRIESIKIYQLRIPFRQAFSHARQTREESDAVVVRVKDAIGSVGYGEALPRPYVTGEDTQSMVSHIRRQLAPRIFAQALTPGWETFVHMRAVLADWTLNRDQGARVIAWNAAYCAVELALLDWTLRQVHAALSDFLPPVRNEVAYSGVISGDSPKEAAALATRFLKFGIRQIKVKVGTSEDVGRLGAIRETVGEQVELRADANGAWSAEKAVEQLKFLAVFKLKAIEQPVGADDFAGMSRVRQETGLPVIADESLVTAEQAARLIDLNACDLFNIRLSKCGGISGSLAIAKLAAEAGMTVQVGAQVGETGILSAAGRTLAAHVPSLAYAEGSFGTWLLTEDVTWENIAFGYAGVAPLLRTRGLSVTVNEEALERFAVDTVELRR